MTRTMKRLLVVLGVYAVFLILLVDLGVRVADMEGTSAKACSGETQEEQPDRVKTDYGVFTVTAYDLSIESCGKALEHPERGVTSSGVDLNGLTRKDAMLVAADPEVLPMGTTVALTFFEGEYTRYDGLYRVGDTGGGVRGRHIDLFLGDEGEEESSAVRRFGTTSARLSVVFERKDHIGDGIIASEDPH